ncbi:MAG: hypothetical protein Q8P50_11310, partial [Bacillota bacterium]|nr:hypothetical protein [Bacillota bacterium]
KQLTKFQLRCRCGAAASVFMRKDARFMGHCPDWGGLTFFSNPVLLERLRHGLPLCPHEPEPKACRSGSTTWCLKCRVRTFLYPAQ